MIIVGGENLIDFIQLDDETSLPVYQANPGGAPYNCAKALGRQGVSTGYLTPISNDSLGDLLADAILDANVKVLGARRSEPTSLAVVSLVDGVASYQFYRENTAERNVTPKGLISITPDETQAVYLGSLALTHGADADVWAEYYCAMKARGIFTALDPNIRPAFIHNRDEYILRLDRVMAHTNLLKLSDEDLEWLIPEKNLEDAAEQILARSSAKILVVTLGAKGAFALISGQKIPVASAQVKGLRDTVGAGDTFMATLLAKLAEYDMLDGEALAGIDASTVKEMLTWAACAAALNCEKDGCDPPNLAELERRMA